jgi:hypothetical protein
MPLDAQARQQGSKVKTIEIWPLYRCPVSRMDIGSQGIYFQFIAAAIVILPLMPCRQSGVQAGGVGNHLSELRNKPCCVWFVRVSLIDACLNFTLSGISGIGVPFSWVTFFSGS